MTNASSYQVRILEWVVNGTGSAIVQAVAGSGKTTTLLESVKNMIGEVLFLAFNKKIAAEIAYKLQRMFLPNANASTVHAAGLNIIKLNRGRRLNVDGDKVRKIIDELIHKDAEDQIKIIASFINRMVTLAKDHAFGVAGQTSIDDVEAWKAIADHYAIELEDCDIDMNEAIQLCIQVLKESNNDRYNLDFGDMIYHVLLFDMKGKQYDWVLLDEAQDTNISRRLLARKLLKDGGRLIAVGDTFQAIYGFSGADSMAMENIKNEFNCQEFPLSICYRCGSNIIAEAQKIVPHIEAYEKNAAGTVESFAYDKFVTDAPSLGINENTGIICRNNAPLIPLAFALIRKGISCRIEGKDIGAQLSKYTFKWKDRNLANFVTKFNDFIGKEIEKALEKKNSMTVGILVDRQETMNALIDRCFDLGEQTVDALQRLILSMFSDTETGKVRKDVVTLCSIHKSKGLEFDDVYLLGKAQFMPSKYAIQEWMLEQESNLEYVAVTRAKSKLVYVTDVPTGNKKPQAA